MILPLTSILILLNTFIGVGIEETSWSSTQELTPEGVTGGLPVAKRTQPKPSNGPSNPIQLRKTSISTSATTTGTEPTKHVLHKLQNYLANKSKYVSNRKTINPRRKYISATVFVYDSQDLRNGGKTGLVTFIGRSLMISV
ncbi:hypothetical protein J4E81_005975 [Alternaria sp. BMP 2799]|nr:hypothetical protein J4E81_005975 [Alternaria sp. BMP 2799]